MANFARLLVVSLVLSSPSLALAHVCGDLSGGTVNVGSVDILAANGSAPFGGEVVRIQALAERDFSSVFSWGDHIGFISDWAPGHVQTVSVRVKDAATDKCGTYRVDFELIAAAPGSACGGGTSWTRSVEVSTCGGGVGAKGAFTTEVAHFALGPATFTNNIKVFRNGVLWASKQQCFTVWQPGCTNCCSFVE